MSEISNANPGGLGGNSVVVAPMDALIAGINASAKLDASAKGILVEFLQAGAPILASLESSAVESLIRWIAGGGDAAAPPVVEQLGQPQVAALLAVTEQEMQAALADRQAQVSQSRAAVNTLASAALALLARLIVSAI